MLKNLRRFQETTQRSDYITKNKWLARQLQGSISLCWELQDETEPLQIGDKLVIGETESLFGEIIEDYKKA